MKFGSYLQQHAVSEWQSMYINYKKLKKLIKKVKSLSNDVIENTGDSEFRNIIRPESLFFHIVSTSDKPWESKFFIELDQQVSKVENFFSEQFKIAICRFNLINEQVDVYLKLKNEKLQKVELSKEVEFASTLEKDLKSMKNKLKNLFSKNPNKEIENVLNCDTTASNSSSSKNRAMEFNLLNDPNTSPSSNDEIVIEDLYQFDQEIINCGRISKYITNDCCGSEDHSSNDNLNQQEDCVKIDLRRIVLPKKNLISESLAKARHLIKHAILENYRFLNLLKSFKVLNTTAILKILKKFDKINIKIQKNFLDKTELSCKSNIVCHCRKFSTLIEKDGIFLTKDKDINEVNTKTEELFVNFTEVKRRKAMKRLRLPQEKNNNFVSWRSGLLVGLSIPILTQILHYIFSAVPEESQIIFKYSWKSYIQLYLGISLPVVFLFMYSMTLLIWTRNKINFVFIFDFNPRDHLAPAEYNLVCGTLMFCLCHLAYCHLYLKLYLFTEYPTLSFGTLLLFLMCSLFNPFNVLYRSSRYWIVWSTWRILASGFYTVEFRDFFLCDLMSSMTYSFVSGALLVCSFLNDFSNLDKSCEISTSYLVPIAASLPSWWRLLQCLRRYKDTKNAFPHINNAFKYIFSLTVVWLSYLSKIESSNRVYWAVFAGIAALYSNYWDLYFDWGLFHGGSQYIFLRKKLVYPFYSYYLAIVFNTILRFSWVFLLSPNNWGLLVNSELTIFILAILELIRRFLWTIFRMENEMANNIDNYRAVHEVPLPFTPQISRN